MLRALSRRSWSFRTSSHIHSQQCLMAFAAAALPDGVDRSLDPFTRNFAAVQQLISDLQSHVRKVLSGGGAEAVKRNRSRNKLCQGNGSIA